MRQFENLKIKSRFEEKLNSKKSEIRNEFLDLIRHSFKSQFSIQKDFL